MYLIKVCECKLLNLNYLWPYCNYFMCRIRPGKISISQGLVTVTHLRSYTNTATPISLITATPCRAPILPQQVAKCQYCHKEGRYHLIERWYRHSELGVFECFTMFYERFMMFYEWFMMFYLSFMMFYECFAMLRKLLQKFCHISIGDLLHASCG